MLDKVFNWFFTTHAPVLRKGGKLGFEVLMLMSVAQVFGLYTPKEVADYQEICYQALYARHWSLGIEN